MNPEHEICSELILMSNDLSEQANDLMVKVLEENIDAKTAYGAITFNSRYQQLNRDQRLRLLKIIVKDDFYVNLLLQNYKYMNKCKKYEFNYIMSEVDSGFVCDSLRLYPPDYLDSLVEKRKGNDKFCSIVSMLKLY